MCTLSFVPRPDGFWLAMNRDEQHTRPIALPPEIFPTVSGRALHPSEPGGGTWICVNDSGLAFSLLNRYDISYTPNGNVLSRGTLIPRLAATHRIPQLHGLFSDMAMRRYRPFRLWVASRTEEQAALWDWDGKRLHCHFAGWSQTHLFSSALDEERATAQRQSVCLARPLEKLTDLRDLHASHGGGQGPFSICMHREDAATVSLTVVNADSDGARMSYLAGAPCRSVATHDTSLPWALC
jgi:hypothetical protein